MFIDIPFIVLRDSVIVVEEIVIWLLHNSHGILLVKRPDIFDVADQPSLVCEVFSFGNEDYDGWIAEHV